VLKAMHLGKRERQEDAVGFWEKKDDGILFAVVADGAGGHGGGAEASTAAVAEAEKCWQAWTGQGGAPDFLADWMSKAHDAVNRSVRHLHADARTVAVALLVQGNRADWVHAGDCRLYHFRQGKLLTRTRDDSVVQVLFEKGEIAEEEMGTHEDQNRLLQAIGGSEPPRPRRGSANLELKDVLLLCSDGFWERLKLKELEGLVATPQKIRAKMLEKTLQLALKRGGGKSDNASVIMIFPGGIEKESSIMNSCWRVLLCVLVAAAVLAIFAAFGPMREKFRELKQKFQSPSRHQMIRVPSEDNQPATPKK
jgi:serine/threonine protein phosphatase PrpC